MSGPLDAALDVRVWIMCAHWVFAGPGMEIAAFAGFGLVFADAFEVADLALTATTRCRFRTGSGRK